jgi:hypothetical protein
MGGALYARPEKKPAFTPVPVTFANNLEVNIFCGDTIKIPLGAQGSRSGTTYKIRQDPKATSGPLIVSTDKNGKGFAIYQHDSDKGPGEDAFLYAAKNPGAAYSAPAKVIVHVKQRPVRLVLDQAAYDFGEVALGSAKELILRIKNLGGTTFTKKLEIQNPWDSPWNRQMLQIEPNQEMEVPVFFRPQTEGRFVQFLDLGESVLTAIQLTGIGRQPIAVFPKNLGVVSGKENETQRKGVLRIDNLLNHSQQITFVTPQELQVIPDILIEGKKSVEINIIANPKQQSGGKYDIEIKSADYQQTIPVIIEPLRAIIEAIPESIWDMGVVSTHPERQEFYIRNKGGSSANVRATFPSWIKMDFKPQEIDPGQKVAVLLQANLKEDYGARRGEILFESETEKISVEVVLQKDPPPIAEIPQVAPTPTTIDYRLWRSHFINVTKIEEKNGSINLEWIFNDDNAPVYIIEYAVVKNLEKVIEEKLRALDVGNANIQLEKIVESRQRLLEEYKSVKKQNSVIEEWLDVSNLNISYDQKSRKATAFFSVPLKTGSHSVRIGSINERGVRSPVNTRINIPIKSQESGVDFKVVAIAIGGVMVLIYFALKFHRVRFVFTFGSRT